MVPCISDKLRSSQSFKPQRSSKGIMLVAPLSKGKTRNKMAFQVFCEPNPSGKSHRGYCCYWSMEPVPQGQVKLEV